ncbi:SGNH/GDSL hydrolase family protein [Microbacterium thalli]|uniref:SGNH/GDSL hydrolase family protein n=1 Tax=Microbacterium thalli TaxID=3027921 RepID=UPI002365DBBE|nr:SGNH/GDSL hydrolase family protein [Microbacterium thalli]MDD7930054.1 SGNH/GDSL hydrolase family protein [Microbacterium thalli]
MGKRRRRSTSDAWWKMEIGGMPVWGILGSVALLTVMAFGTIASIPPAPTADPNRTTAPVPSFAFDDPPETTSPHVAFLGDSYTFGTGRSEGSENRWTTIVSNALAWDEERFAVGGTGYVQGDSYTNRVGLVIAAAPDVVIVSGGRNDWRVADQVEAAATTVFSQLRDALPEATIIATNPWWDDDPAPAEMTFVSEAVRSAADATGIAFVDIGQPLEGHPEYLSEDGVHPNDDGYRVIADAVEPLLRELVPATT